MICIEKKCAVFKGNNFWYWFHLTTTIINYLILGDYSTVDSMLIYSRDVDPDWLNMDPDPIRIQVNLLIKVKKKLTCKSSSCFYMLLILDRKNCHLNIEQESKLHGKMTEDHLVMKYLQRWKLIKRYLITSVFLPLLKTWIQKTKWMRIRPDPDPKHWY